MIYLLHSIFLSIFLIIPVFSTEENFLLIDGKSGDKLVEIGTHIEERVTPCSTFKIALSLMGFDSEILKNENNPVWLYQEGYEEFLES